MNYTIVPALIPRSCEDVFATAERIKSFAREMQIDVVDGVLVDAVSWPYGLGDMQGNPSQIGNLTKMCDIEFDLMVADPLLEVPRYIAARPKRIIVHANARPDIETIAHLVHEEGIQFGIATTNDTPLEYYLDILQYADYAQCMGITPVGAQGRPFDVRTLERVRAVRAQFPEMEIAVDGSVNAETIPLLRDAGVTRFVSGSAILGAPDPQVAYEHLRMLITE
jgi:ribulose-phosphate 3-epimerase